MLQVRIRITSRNPEEVEVSWIESGSQESYQILNPLFLRDFQKGWKRLCSYYFHLLDGSNPFPSNQCNLEIHNKGMVLSSLLFGKRWKDIISFTKRKLASITFITDPEWTQLPYEILPVKEEEFNPLYLHVPVYRSIRSQETYRKGKKGKDTLLWFHLGLGNSKEEKVFQEFIEKEKTQLEEIFQDASARYESITTREGIRPYLWERIHEVKYLHFAGHTELNFIPIDSKNFLEYKEIGNLDLSNLELVFWNSCYSGYQDQSTKGLVSEILRAGAREFIGFNYLLPSSIASWIGVEFWKLFFKTKNSKKAIIELRRSLHKNGKGIAASLIVHYNQEFISSQVGEKKKIHSLVVAGFMLLVAIFSFSLYQIQEKTKLRETHSPSLELNINEIPVINNLQNNPKELQNPKIEKPTHSTNFYKPSHPNQSSAHTKLSANKKIELEELINSFQSEPLKIAARKFLNEENKLYDPKEREKILIDILSKSHESNELKIWKIEKKRNAW